MEAASGERTAFILLTDIYRSTQLWEKFPQEFGRSLEQHNSLVEETVLSHGGEIMKNLGDGYIAIFNSADSCTISGVEVQRKLRDIPPLPDGSEILVRIVGHGGPLQPLAAGRGYFGRPLNRASRICQICHPGQMLVSEKVADALLGLPEEVQLLKLGSHHLRDLAEPERLFQVDHPDFPLHRFPQLATLEYRPNNLVYQPNAFVGREKELSELREILASDSHRITTITAPGGYGKSRLATQLCADLLDNYQHGTFVVYLAPVGDHTRITGAAAAALGFQFYAHGDAKQQFLDYLREKEMLLLLDNFEHVIEGKKLLAEVLQQAPGVRLIVTSREPLRLQGEKVYRLDPLLVGDSGKEAEGDLSDAVALFVDRASLVKHDFRVTRENVCAIEDICRKLEGVPLSIELAAAWMDAFTLPELLVEVEHQLELTARMDDLPARHRSIRASLDWSYGLLSKELKEVLRTLATFKGGFFLDAGNAITPQPNLRTMLVELCDKGWLFTREVGAKTRFFIRDAASREYAFQKLRESEDWERAVVAHSNFFASLLESEAEKLKGHDQHKAMDVLSLEIENIYEAVDTALNRKNKDLMTRFARDLISYMDVGSRWQEGLLWYERIVDLAEKVGDRALRMHAGLGAGRLLWRLGRYEDAEKLLLQAKEIAEEDGEPEVRGAALNNLGVVAWRLDSIERAENLLSESLNIYRELNDAYGMASCLNNLGVCARVQGRHDDAERLFRESLAMDRNIGNHGRVALTLSNLGVLMYYRDLYEDARANLTESQRICRETGYQYGMALSGNNLGVVARASGDFETAEQHFLESLQTNRDIGNNYGLVASLVNLAMVSIKRGRTAHARDRLLDALRIGKELEGVQTSIEAIVACGDLLFDAGDHEAAALLLAGVKSQIDRLGDTFDPVERQEMNESWAQVEEALAVDELSAAKARGEKMSMDQLAAFAQQALESMPDEVDGD